MATSASSPAPLRPPRQQAQTPRQPPPTTGGRPRNSPHPHADGRFHDLGRAATTSRAESARPPPPPPRPPRPCRPGRGGRARDLLGRRGHGRGRAAVARRCSDLRCHGSGRRGGRCHAATRATSTVAAAMVAVSAAPSPAAIAAVSATMAAIAEPAAIVALAPWLWQLPRMHPARTSADATVATAAPTSTTMAIATTLPRPCGPQPRPSLSRPWRPSTSTAAATATVATEAASAVVTAAFVATGETTGAGHPCHDLRRHGSCRLMVTTATPPRA